jgi:ubiquitin-protein ligase
MSIISKHNHIYYKSVNNHVEKYNILGYNPNIIIFEENIKKLEEIEKIPIEKVRLLFKDKKNKEDYQKLYQNYIKNYENSNNSTIPKSLLFEPNDLFKLMMKQYEKVKMNYQIDLIEDNLFNFSITKDDIEINIKYHYQLTPYYPPEIKIIKPNYDISFLTGFYHWKILNPQKWNPSITPLELINTIFDLIKKYAINIDNNKSIDNNSVNNEIFYLLINLAKTEKLTYQYLEFDDNLLTLSINNSRTTQNKYWASGTGYGHGKQNDFDIKKYLEYQQNTQEKLIEITNQIIEFINKDNSFDFNKTCLLSFIKSRLFKTAILDWEKNIKLYQSIIQLTKLTINKKLFNNDNLNQLYHLLISNENEFINYQMLNKEKDEYHLMINDINNIIQEIKPKENKKIISNDIKELYLNELKNLQFDTIDLKNYYYHKNLNSNKMTNPKSLKRIMKEVSTLSNSLPINWESSVYIRIDPKNIQCLQFLIIASDKTPYMNGCFLFDVFFPSDYPNKPPMVNLQTTGKGTVRFNPNLYNCGKVCLSLLGTWSGQQGESWNADTSTLLQVIISIQSLIMVEQPYYNEPGYEKIMNTPEGNKRSTDYNQKIMKETLRWSMLEMLKEPPKGFEQVINTHFKYKKNEIIEQLQQWEKFYNNNLIFTQYYQEFIDLLNKF